MAWAGAVNQEYLDSEFNPQQQEDDESDPQLLLVLHVVDLQIDEDLWMQQPRQHQTQFKNDDVIPMMILMIILLMMMKMIIMRIKIKNIMMMLMEEQEVLLVVLPVLNDGIHYMQWSKGQWHLLIYEKNHLMMIYVPSVQEEIHCFRK